jgi:hypothetical protein
VQSAGHFPVSCRDPSRGRLSPHRGLTTAPTTGSRLTAAALLVFLAGAAGARSVPAGGLDRVAGLASGQVELELGSAGGFERRAGNVA